LFDIILLYKYLKKIRYIEYTDKKRKVQKFRNLFVKSCIIVVKNIGQSYSQSKGMGVIKDKSDFWHTV